jgi:hypothetical protein
MGRYAHAHDHHGHTHSHGGSPELPPQDGAQAGVAIEVGPGLGALVIYPAERYRGLEIEISPVDDAIARRVHTGVHERQTFNGSALTAIFGSLPSGDYVIWADEDTAGPTVTVPEAGVAELSLD